MRKKARKRKQRKEKRQNWRGKFGVRDTGIFREVVPLDESALVTDVLESASKPQLFLEDCKEYRNQALGLLRRRGFPADPMICTRLPKDEFDARWLTLPTEIADAFRLVLAVDWIEELFEGPRLVRACSATGRELLTESQAADRFRQLPAAEAQRLSQEVGQRDILEIAGNALRIGELSQKLLVRPKEKYARGGAGRFKALRKATRTSVASRRERAAEKKATRAREMRRLMANGMSQSSAARHLERNREDLGKYTSFYNSIIPAKKTSHPANVR